MDHVLRWTQQSSRFRHSRTIGRSLCTAASYPGHPLEPLQLKKRKLSAAKSMNLASVEASISITTEHVVAVMKTIFSLRHLLGRAHAESVWEVVGAEAALVLRYCSHMNWIPEVLAVVDVFCSHIARLLQWNNVSPAFWQPFSDIHVQPLLQFCSKAMTSLMNMLEAGKASAVCSASKLLSVAVTCLSFGWQRAKSSVVKRGDVSRGNATVLVRACASLCACVNAARSCSNMALLVPLVTSLSRVRSLLECAWTLVASAMQLRSHVSGSNAAEAWAVACTQTTSFLLLLHAPVRAELIAPLLFEGEPLFSSLPCGATRGEMLHSATVHQRSALTVTHCLDYRGPMAGLQQIVSRGA